MFSPADLRVTFEPVPSLRVEGAKRQNLGIKMRWVCPECTAHNVKDFSDLDSLSNPNLNGIEPIDLNCPKCEYGTQINLRFTVKAEVCDTPPLPLDIGHNLLGRVKDRSANVRQRIYDGDLENADFYLGAIWGWYALACDLGLEQGVEMLHIFEQLKREYGASMQEKGENGHPQNLSK